MTFYKLEIFIPKTHFAHLQTALRSVDAGHIGNYDSCLSYSEVIGTWRPLDNATPYMGKRGEITQQPELKVDVRILSKNLDKTLSAIKDIHPYETPVINIIPLQHQE